MTTGIRGTYVISWSQTEIDGLRGAPPAAMATGSAWCWHGQALRVDGPPDLLRLAGAVGEAGLRRCAARNARRLLGQSRRAPHPDDTAPTDRTMTAFDPTNSSPLGSDLGPARGDPALAASAPFEEGFVLTDGHSCHSATLIRTDDRSTPLLMFTGALPPAGQDLWVVEHVISHRPPRATPGPGGGVICFTPGTRISTPDGPRLVETLAEGDRVLTKDNGPQDILWIGGRRLSGARLHLMPELRPVRISAGAFGIERPEEGFLVSPDHRLLVQGLVAQRLFNTPEVLVAARDLVNGHNIRRATALREVHYVHLLLPAHQVVWANGVETESFHPASASLAALSEADRARLLAGWPGLAGDPGSYGAQARRNLSAPEAAILRHEAA
ncbi:Hint domain-containing protein [Pseudooceanicola aestuarii]|uniref:Hint domain-containing protein n=1 Tax=Pseudooceanicola aestuarii TaxID=2697319 RepID=UPI0013CFA0C7|nr:Hint domain-containing protein [Pseudooceanicola aestuarii]